MFDYDCLHHRVRRDDAYVFLFSFLDLGILDRRHDEIHMLLTARTLIYMS